MSRLMAVARETFRESRGLALWILLILSSILFVEIGLRLQCPMDLKGSLAGAFFYGGIAFLAVLIAAASGSRQLQQDRSAGVGELLLSKPLSPILYFLGRFLGLATRLTLVFAAALLAGGLYLFLRGSNPVFAHAESAVDPFPMRLLQQGGPPATWIFEREDGEEEPASLRFRFRPRFPRDKPIVTAVTLRIVAFQEDVPLLDETVTLHNRKSLNLPLGFVKSGPVRVSLFQVKGQNFLEVGGQGCLLVRGESGLPIPLAKAGLSFLPVLYLTLALSLFLSTFLSTPTALLATTVLALFVTMGPSLKADLTLPDAWTGTAAPVSTPRRALAHALSLLPDPGRGGGVEPLSRMESPTWDQVLAPWQEALPHLVVLLLAGSLLAGRKER